MRIHYPKATFTVAGTLAAVLIGVALFGGHRQHAGSPPQPTPNRVHRVGKPQQPPGHPPARTARAAQPTRGLPHQVGLPPQVGSITIRVVHEKNGNIHIFKTIVVGSTTTSLSKPLLSDALPTAGYTIGETFHSTGASPTAAFDALWTARRKPPPTLAASIQTAAVPWLAHTTWALVPVGLADPSQGGIILWFGQSTAKGHWTWIPVDGAGAIPGNLPYPLRATLQWGDDLATNAPGPSNLLGMHPWASVAGQVQPPAAWSLQTQGATLNVWVWCPSTHYTPLYFAPWGIWTQTNAVNGHQALDQISAAAVALPKAVLANQAP